MTVSEKNSEIKLIFLECIVAVICPHYRNWENVMTSPARTVSTITPKHHALAKWGMLVEQQGWREGIYGLCVDREGVGVVKRETNLNPNKSQILSKCMLLLHVYDAILLREQH
jgi:hypothetical protein